MSVLTRFRSRIKGMQQGFFSIFNQQQRSWLIRGGQAEDLNPDTSPRALVAQYVSWVYVMAYKNAVTIAEVPLRLFVANGSNVAATKAVDPSVLKRFQEDASLQRLPHVKQADMIEEIVEHPVLSLLENVNAWDNGFETLMLISIFLDLTGNTFLWVPQNRSGMPPDQMVVLPTQWVKPIRNKQDLNGFSGTVKLAKDGVIKGYLFGTSVNRSIFIPVEEIVHFKRPNPENPWWGKGALEAQIMAAARDWAMDVYEQAINKNMGRPSMIISPKGEGNTLTEAERKAMQADWAATLQGVHQAGKVLVSSGMVDIKDTAFKPKEMNHPLGRKEAMEKIANGFGVPVSLVKSEGVPRANLESSLFQYMRFTILPTLRMIQQKMNERLIPMFDNSDFSVSNRVFLAFDNPVPEDKEFKLKRTTDLVGGSIMTINEGRAEEGLEPIPDGDVVLVSSTSIPLGSAISSPDDKPPAKSLKAGVLPDNNALSGGVEKFIQVDGVLCKHHKTKGSEFIEDPEGFVEVLHCGCCHTKQNEPDLPPQEERTGGSNPPLDSDEKQLRAVVNKMYADQAADVLKQSPLSIDFDSAFYANKYVPQAEPIIARVAVKAGNAQLAEAGIEVFAFVDNPKVEKAIADGTFKFLNQTSLTVQADFKAQLAEGINQGESIEQLTKRLKGVFEGLDQSKRARLIARTETARAQTLGKISAMGEAGFSQKRWVEASDSCPFCQDLMNKFNDAHPINTVYIEEGQVQEVEFGKNADGTPHMIKLKHNYGDVIGPPTHPQCRGTMIFER